MRGDRAARDGPERGEPIVEHRAEITEADHPGPGGGEFQGERDAVEGGRDVGQVAEVGVVRSPTGALGRDPVGEQRDRRFGG
ncbi:hypothetical protein Q0Z83_047490 [Actinoplanes sichuanensis]|nr:hypothetical protein Q0Z83_047490 [Actinoplanes sichuanensis]